MDRPAKLDEILRDAWQEAMHLNPLSEDYRNAMYQYFALKAMREADAELFEKALTYLGISKKA